MCPKLHGITQQFVVGYLDHSEIVLLRLAQYGTQKNFQERFDKVNCIKFMTTVNKGWIKVT